MEKISKLIRQGLHYSFLAVRKIFFIIVMTIISLFLLYAVKTVLGINLFEDLSIVDFLEFFFSIFQGIIQ